MRFIASLLFCTVALFPAILLGQDNDSMADTNKRPLWEWGIGGGGAYVPNYPASDNYQLRGLGLPYFIYRGAILRSGDGGGMRATAIESPSFELSLSLSAAFNADSDDNDDRIDMPDLDFLLGVGPQTIVRLYEERSKERLSQRLDWRIKTRAMFSFDIDRVNHQGFVIETRLRYMLQNLGGTDNRLWFAFGPIFATEKLHRYFYEVAPSYARDFRPAYAAQGGYLGSEASIGTALWLHPKWRMFLGTRIGYYGGAANSNSPLFKNPWNYSIAFGIVWKIQQSDEQARNQDF